MSTISDISCCITQVNGSANSAIVTGLLGHTTYSCTIYGYSQINGPVSNPLSVTTLQGGMYVHGHTIIIMS